MRSIECKARFNDFYNATYQSAMIYCLSKTGDFINSEDLLTDAYYTVYKAIIKDKNGKLQQPEKVLHKALNERISRYWKKHKKEQVLPLLQETSQAWLTTELDITAQKAERQMVVQDVLEFVSTQPELHRRTFAMYFYLDMAKEEIAKELGVSVDTVAKYIDCILQRINDNVLIDHE